MLSTRQLHRSNNQPANYAALTQFAPEPTWAGMASFVTAASRSSFRSLRRLRNALAAFWLFFDGRKKRRCFGCLFSAPAFAMASCGRAPALLMPSPPAGAVPARISLDFRVLPPDQQRISKLMGAIASLVGGSMHAVEDLVGGECSK